MVLAPHIIHILLTRGDNFFIDGGTSTSINIRTQFARNAIIANSDNGGSGTVELYHSSGGTATKRLETSGVGVTVYDQLDTTHLNVSGVSTFSDDIFVGTGATVGFGSTAYFEQRVHIADDKSFHIGKLKV